MIEIVGKYNTAKVLTDYVEPEAYSQILTLCNQEFAKDSQIRVMPDVHAGKGCVVGLAMEVKDTIVPNLVGVDIGCGMSVTKFKADNIDLEALDKFIRENIPSGFNVNKLVGRDNWEPLSKNNYWYDEYNYQYKEGTEYLKSVRCYLANEEHLVRSMGTLGGGNHFIEVNIDSDGDYYLVIHSGSRNLGVQICKYYQDIAVGMCSESNVPKELSFLSGQMKRDYVYDVAMASYYAESNRACIKAKILGFLGVEQALDSFETVHNYIDEVTHILRKGCVSAKEGEKLIIPINMRDGSLICKGKGNADWLNTAPHGAGRVLSRGKAKEQIKYEDFVESMKGIYSTSVTESNIDESPMVYKSLDEIKSHIGDVVEIVEHIKPIYNFKA